MSLVSAPSLDSISVPHATPRNQSQFMLSSSESPTSQVSPSMFGMYESSHEEHMSASSSSGHKSSIIKFSKAIVAASSQDVTFSAPLSLAIDNPATLSWTLTWGMEQELVDDAGEPELPDEGFVYSAKEARAEEERRRLLWSNPQASRILRRRGFIPPPSPPPEICSTRLRGASTDKDDKAETQHTTKRRSHVAFRGDWP